MTEAQLNPFTNFWYEVYDFTPSQVVHNWTYSKAYVSISYSTSIWLVICTNHNSELCRLYVEMRCLTGPVTPGA